VLALGADLLLLASAVVVLSAAVGFFAHRIGRRIAEREDKRPKGERP
jgi:hypothetical protein